MQGLRKSRSLKSGVMDLHVGNGARAPVIAIGSYELTLSNGLVLVLDNVHYAPSITRNIISVDRLRDIGYKLMFTEIGITVSKDNLFYFNAIPRNGIFEIVMDDISVFTCATKRTKYDLNKTYLWHCRLGHINKKRISKLQCD